MSTFAALLVVGLAWAPPSPQQLPPPPEPAPPQESDAGQDSLAAIEHADFVLGTYYRRVPLWFPGRDRRTRDFLGQPFERRCDGDRGDVCFAGDPDAGRCPNFVRCHSTQKWLVRALLEAVSDHPDSGYLTGQAVYLLTKLDRLPEAMEIVDGCTAAPWWCAALRGYVLHAQSEDVLADATLHGALAQAPDSVRCVLTDATWVLGRWNQRGAARSVPDAHEELASWDCAQRMAASDTIWWLSDPLYSAPGNERWVEHVTRSMSARFRAEIRDMIPGTQSLSAYRDNAWADHVRRGPVDSYDSNNGFNWTSHEAAPYHFVPDLDPPDLSTPLWRLEADFDDEGFGPRSLGPFVPLPYQIARFRVGDSLRVTGATLVRDSPVSDALDATATLVLTDAPESMPLRLAADGRLAEPRFMGRAPARDYVASVEVVTSKGVGWGRSVLPSLQTGVPEVSDLLLYAPGGDTEPRDVTSALDVMLASTRLEENQTVGVFWETYDAPAGSTLEFELSVERASGSRVDRLRRLVPGAGNDQRGTLTWTEPATGATHPTAISLDLRDLGKGDYVLVLRVGWAGRTILERRRAFEIG